jgi:hypothetical protein
LFSAGVLSIGVEVDLVLAERAFLYLSSIATVSLITTWTMILFTQWLFRRPSCATGPAPAYGCARPANISWPPSRLTGRFRSSRQMAGTSAVELGLSSGWDAGRDTRRARQAHGAVQVIRQSFCRRAGPTVIGDAKT